MREDFINFARGVEQDETKFSCTKKIEKSHKISFLVMPYTHHSKLYCFNCLHHIRSSTRAHHRSRSNSHQRNPPSSYRRSAAETSATSNLEALFFHFIKQKKPKQQQRYEISDRTNAKIYSRVKSPSSSAFLRTFNAVLCCVTGFSFSLLFLSFFAFFRSLSSFNVCSFKPRLCVTSRWFLFM